MLVAEAGHLLLALDQIGRHTVVWAVMVVAVVGIRLEEILLFHQRQELLIPAAAVETVAQVAQE
jgi:hypothetical protein